MYRALVFVLLVACGVSCYRLKGGWEQETPHRLLTGPYVLLTGPQQAMVAFRMEGGQRATIDWVAESGVKGSKAARRSGDLYQATLSDLPRGPVIKYEVKLDGVVAGKGEFRVGLNPGETKFRFAAFGDTRTNHQVHRSVVEGVTREKIDFFLHTGDMVERGGKAEQWITFFQIERDLMMKAPIIPAIGNHDVSNRGYYERFFFLDTWSNGKNYFVHDWGNLRLVALDFEIECDKRCAQYRFVARALAEGAKQGKILMLFMHYPPYSSGAHGPHLGVRPVIHELAKTYGVELVITGHDHHYERTKPIDGTTYLVSGSAGAPIRPVRPQPWTAEARTEPHFVLIDVDGDKISMRAVNLRGEVFDDTTLELNPPGGPPPKPDVPK